jgi:hypothetical protein
VRAVLKKHYTKQGWEESVHVHACACALEGSNRVHANGAQGCQRWSKAWGGCLCRVLSKVYRLRLFPFLPYLYYAWPLSVSPHIGFSSLACVMELEIPVVGSELAWIPTEESWSCLLLGY